VSTPASNAPGLRQVRFSFIIPVRDDARRLARCLDTVRANLDQASGHQSGQLRGHEIIVADNGSTDDSAAVAMAAGATVLSIPNQPVAIVRNRAAAIATGDVLAFIDADHALASGWLTAAADALSGDDVVAAGAAYDTPSDGTWVQRAYDAFRDHQPGQSDAGWLASGNLAVKRELFLGVGGFDESLETCEDVDLCKRLQLTGKRVLTDSRLASTHYGDPRTLNALFWGELWRGRDNLRVSLRPPLRARELPSIVIPILYLGLLLLALLALIAGLAAAPFGAPSITGISVTVFAAALVGLLALSALRVSRMVGRMGSWRSDMVWRAFMVAATYDVARALALVVRVGHRARRRSDPRTSTA
jgi:GT2 family glycosyltransferase